MLTWKRKKQHYSNGEIGYLGKMPVCSVDWDSGSPPKGKPYKLTNHLPGLAIVQGHYVTPKEAKERQVVLVQNWLSKASVKII